MSGHTYSDSGHSPSELQRGLNDYDRDTIAYLAMLGVNDDHLRRVLAFSGKRQEVAK